MLFSYIKIAYRNLVKHRLFSAINIVGLALGIASSMILVQYIDYELSYDAHNENADNIYRLSVGYHKNGTLENQSARVAPGPTEAFSQEFPEIRDFTRMIILGLGIVSNGDRHFNETKIFLTDKSHFNVFSYRTIAGDLGRAMEDPFSIVISERTAKALFGDDDPIDKTIEINSLNLDGSVNFVVRGVYANTPENAHIHPDVLISYPTLFEFVGHQFDNSWQWNNTYTYMLLQHGVNPKELEQKFQPIAKSNTIQLVEAGQTWQYHLQPLRDIHLRSDIQFEAEVNGDARNIYFLALVALVIIVVAYLNFVNLSMVRATARMGEVGVRKAAGANRQELITQFFAESVLINLIAFAFAFTLVQVFVPVVRTTMGVELHATIFNSLFLTSLFVGAWLLCLLSSTIYPALYLSGLKVSQILKGRNLTITAGASSRKLLVFAQFAVSIMLIASTLVISNQLYYMKKKDLGVKLEQQVAIKAPKVGTRQERVAGPNFPRFRQELSQYPFVESVTASTEIPGREIFRFSRNVELDGEPIATIFSLMVADTSFTDHYEVPTLAGRSPRLGQPEILINESALKKLGLSDAHDAIGKRLRNGFGENVIVGVIGDFHQRQLRLQIDPLIIHNGRSLFNFYSVRLSATAMPEAMASIESTYQKLFPGSPFEYFFVDDFYMKQYQGEERFGLLFKVFTSLSVVIACLGLLGLSSFYASKRAKEVGIRKVLGATVTHIIALLSKDFVVLVLLASLFALPVSYWALNLWLNNYAYHMELTWGFLVLPAALVLALALFAASLFTLKTARENPVKALRYE